MRYSKFLTSKRKNELKKINVILQEIKNYSFLSEGKLHEKRKAFYLNKINESIHKYYTYTLIERELNSVSRLSEALSLVSSEDASVAFLLKNLHNSTKNNEVGLYIENNFKDLIRAVENLQSNVKEQESGPVNQKQARFGGYGSKMPTGTAGLIKELFGSPSGPLRGPARYSGHPNIIDSDLEPFPSEEEPEKFGKQMSSHDLGLERQRNISIDNEKSMEILEKKLPEAVEFLTTFVEFFSDEENIVKLSRPDKKGFFGGSSKEKLISSAFKRFPGFNSKILSRDLEDNSQLAHELGTLANQMYNDVHKLKDVKTHLRDKIITKIKDRLKGFADLAGSMKGTMFSRPS